MVGAAGFEPATPAVWRQCFLRCITLNQPHTHTDPACMWLEWTGVDTFRAHSGHSAITSLIDKNFRSSHQMQLILAKIILLWNFSRGPSRVWRLIRHFNGTIHTPLRPIIEIHPRTCRLETQPFNFPKYFSGNFPGIFSTNNSSLNLLEVGEWVRRYEGAVWSDSI